MSLLVVSNHDDDDSLLHYIRLLKFICRFINHLRWRACLCETKATYIESCGLI